MEPEFVLIEPKYCELCGGLWLRRTDCATDVCPRCSPLAAELAQARRAAEGGEA